MLFELLNWKDIENEKLSSLKILFNNEEIKKNVNAEIELLKNTIDELSSMPKAEMLLKEKKAHYKHFIEVIDVYRRDLKNKWNKPFQILEEEIKDIVKVIDDGVALLDQKLDEKKLEKSGITSKMSEKILDKRIYTVVADKETHSKIKKYIINAVKKANSQGKFSAEVLEEKTWDNNQKYIDDINKMYRRKQIIADPEEDKLI